MRGQCQWGKKRLGKRERWVHAEKEQGESALGNDHCQAHEGRKGKVKVAGREWSESKRGGEALEYVWRQ